MTLTPREIQANEARDTARARREEGRRAIEQATAGTAAPHPCNPPPASRYRFGMQWVCPRCSSMWRCDGEKWVTEAEARGLSRTA